MAICPSLGCFPHIAGLLDRLPRIMHGERSVVITSSPQRDDIGSGPHEPTKRVTRSGSASQNIVLSPAINL